MKSLKLSLLAVTGSLFLLSFSADAQQVAKNVPVKSESAAQAKSGLGWKEDIHNFGEIAQGKPVSHDFTFKNTTKETVFISNVKAQCGCTATNYTKTPIKPGETGSITATFNAATPGNFSKTVTVTTSDTEVKKILTIKGNVIATNQAN